MKVSHMQDDENKPPHRPRPPRPPRPPRRPLRAKLTPELIAEIRRRLAGGEYQHDIAAELHVNQGRISEINTGKRSG